jgi:hypothetical protein
VWPKGKATVFGTVDCGFDSYHSKEWGIANAKGKQEARSKKREARSEKQEKSKKRGRIKYKEFSGAEGEEMTREERSDQERKNRRREVWGGKEGEGWKK